MEHILVSGNLSTRICYVTVKFLQRHHSKQVLIFSQCCPSLLAAAPLSVRKVTSLRERGAQRSGVGRRRGCRGTRSKTQEVEKDEELRDNVMHRGAELEERRRRKPRRNAGRGEGGGGEAERRESTGCVHLALGGREKIAWAMLAGRVCLCLIEEGCETETPNWLG